MHNGMPEALGPHDLLWLHRCSLKPGMSDMTIPEWVLAGHGPVVVRRAEAPPGWVPVGVRGSTRADRFAAFAPVNAVERCLDPFSLRAQKTWLQHPDCHRHPVLRTLNRIAAVLDRLGLHWGITGSLGYELATGEPQLRAGSDLDLLIDRPTPMPRADAALLCRKLSEQECRIDVQLETSQGAVALSEWARPSGEVLLKTCTGPRLTDSPWLPVPEGRVASC